MQTDVRQKQPHRPPLGDLMGLVQILARAVEVAGDGAVEGAGEEAPRQIVYSTAATPIEHVNAAVDESWL